MGSRERQHTPAGRTGGGDEITGSASTSSIRVALRAADGGDRPSLKPEELRTKYLVPPVGRAEDEEDASDFEPGEETDDNDEDDHQGHGGGGSIKDGTSSKRKRSTKDDSDGDSKSDDDDDERPPKR
ncbi:hypothetical protein C4D60_Mb11t22720 [Musa balbisiana]|uniref:Uncharacterized protein n=1 Tax=Musa balbisiana TaxID=52838 RepID=A0A4S8J648_MUSBA|nr:hypothetical protein C4D60_Mb11t22720 [Musa balbisiana]